ncbi:MAG TPA: TMEM175 family protein [Stellaceae bacterium]|jgi:uncharacterized membrane protein
MFARSRLDALGDGIFAVAMTLLVLDLRLPDDFHPQSAAEFVEGLATLWPKLLPYVLSFSVLGMRWLANVELRTREEFFGRKYVDWWLFYLLLITCVPFSTIVVSRYGNFAPAVWLYIGHTMLIALISMRLVYLTPGLEPGEHLRRRQTGAIVLAVTAVLAFGLSFLSPRDAIWAFTLNFLAPRLTRRLHRTA